jgi:hypothetical protein
MTTWYLSTNATVFSLQQLITAAVSGDTIKITPYSSNGTFVAASDTISIWAGSVDLGSFNPAYDLVGVLLHQA